METMNNIQQMKQLKEKGLSYESIGEIFGKSRQRIHQLISGYIAPVYRKQKKYKWVKILFESIFERDNYTCQKCGERGTLIHHIDKDDSNNDIKNLICFCNNCHLNLHRPKEMSEIAKEKDRQSNLGKKHSEKVKKGMSLKSKLRKRNIKGQFI